MGELGEEEKEKVSHFIELSLSLILRGFDEMEMPKRLELVKLLGFMIDLYFNKHISTITNLDSRVKKLEETHKKK